MIVGVLNLSNEVVVVPLVGSERIELKISLCNTLSMDNTFYIYIQNSKSELSSVLYFNFPLLAFDTYTLPFTISIATGDTISAKATNSGIALTIFK